MIKTTIPFTFSHLKTPKKRYYVTRFVVIVKRCVFGLRLGSVRVTPIPEVTKFYFWSSLKYIRIISGLVAIQNPQNSIKIIKFC